MSGIIEWSMVHRRPFATSARFDFYDSEKFRKTMKNGKTLSLNESNPGEIPVIKGLRDFAQIDFRIDAKTTPNANRKAGASAHAAFRKIRAN